MATPTTNAVPTTTIDPAALGAGRFVFGGDKWGGGLGEAVVLTYSFPPTNLYHTAAYGDYTNGGEWTKFFALSAGEQAGVRAGLAAWASVANITFVETADDSTTAGELRFAYTNFDNADEEAHAYLPSNDAWAGDVWFSFNNFNPASAASIRAGSNDFETIIHEQGHALGLKHSFDAPNAIARSHDSYFYSIMSYSAKAGGPDGIASFYPTTPMYNDLLTIQALYGRNREHNAGDTTYKFVDGRSYFQTIDDAGGHDRIIYAGALASTIDLRQGHFSTLSAPIVFSDMTSTRASVAIGPNSVIEDASGGSAGDKIFGNTADNHLYGRGGNDVLTGGAGHDAFFFNASLSTTTNVDRVTDFHHGIDSFELAHGLFTHIAHGTLTSAAFFVGTAAHDGNDHIIYDKAHGALYFDADGSGAGAAIEFATVTAGLKLSAADFIIY